MHIAAEAAAVDANQFDGPHGGSWHPEAGRLPAQEAQPSGSGNPLLLVAALAAAAAVLRLLCGENLRDRIARHVCAELIGGDPMGGSGNTVSHNLLAKGYPCSCQV